MRYIRVIFKIFSVFVLFTDIVFCQQNNSVEGRVIMPSQKTKILSRNLSYSSLPRGVITEDEHFLHNASHPDLNSFVILYPLSFTPKIYPTPNALITQKAQTFIPHVLAVTKGSTIYILNEDNEYHNVFSRTPKASFNIGRRPPGHLYPQQINKVGLIKLFCDIHEHMKAYVLSLETPYFTRIDEFGQYKLDHVPNGEYRLEIFHLNSNYPGLHITLENGREEVIDIDLTEE